MEAIDIQGLFEAKKAEIISHAVDSLKTQVQNQIGWQMGNQIETACAEYFKENILPELKAELESKKGEILLAISQSCVDIGVAISKSLVEKATKNLASSWNSSKITEALFK
jgi:hypothetical protein